MNAAAPKPTGRPTIRTEAIVDTIIEAVTAGTPLAEILRSDPAMPKPTTFYDWLRGDEALSERFARAREFGFDAIAVETLKIADDASADWIPGKNGPMLDAEHVSRSKLRIETRLKLLSKWDPKRYGDRLELDGKVDGNVTVNIARLAPDKPE